MKPRAVILHIFLLYFIFTNLCTAIQSTIVKAMIMSTETATSSLVTTPVVNRFTDDDGYIRDRNWRYCCSQCSRTFISTTNLVKHGMSYHSTNNNNNSNNNSNQCEICNKTFASETLLKRHFTTVHQTTGPDSKKFSCMVSFFFSLFFHLVCNLFFFEDLFKAIFRCSRFK